MKKLSLLILGLLTLLPVKADEGMWTLYNLPQAVYDQMKAYGFSLPYENLYSSDNAIKNSAVLFGGFCSGVVVSPDGLVFTNHHCGFEAIRSHSTVEHDYMLNGFYAKDYKDELPNENLFVSFMVEQQDVTARLEALGIHSLPFDKQSALIDSIAEVMTDSVKKIEKTLHVEIDPYYEGNQYFATTYRLFPDVRLVFAVPKSMGKFGGETDNWMWPRQTCDFSVFRIYTDANNEPAEYSPSNQPMKPLRYARVSTDGYQKGDYCMTIGYPGSTNRYLSSYGIIERMENTNAARINVRGVKQDVWKKWMDSDPAIRLQYASKYASSSNYWKNSIGMNKALKELNVVEDKQKQEQLISAWIQKDSKRQESFGNLLENLEKAYAGRKDGNHALAFLNESFIGGPDLLRIALYYTNLQKAKDEEAKEAYKNRLRQQYKDWNQEVDKETMTALIDNYAKQVGKDFLPSFYQTIEKEYGNNTRAYVDAMFKQTLLADTSCIDLSPTQEQKDGDMALGCLKSVMELGAKVSKDIKDYSLVVTGNERLLCEAILEMEMDQPHYSDANSTMRLSYGFVNDYTGASGHQDYFTTMPSLLDKVAQSGEIADYKVEPEVKALFEEADFGPYKDARSGEMQLCFLTNNDITGGNSGSPMFNGKGELIGLAFDGNWDAMSSDISFTQDLTRCIGVDIRYVLYVIDRWGHADRLIQEVGLK